MSNGHDFAKVWSRISWSLLASGLLVLGLSMWFNWPTLIPLIGMTVGSLGLLMRIIWLPSVRAREPIRWYLAALLITMLFGITPVLLILAYVFTSTDLLWAAGIVAGISVVTGIMIGWVLSQVADVRDAAEVMRGVVEWMRSRRTHKRPAESSEGDEAPQG